MAVTIEEIVEQIRCWCQEKEGRSHHIAHLNAYCVTLAAKNSRLRHIYNGADIAAPDGMPFVTYMRLIKRMPCGRCAGPDLFLRLAQESSASGWSIFLYGGTPEVLAEMRCKLERDFSGIRIVGDWAPPFRPLTPEEDIVVTSRINELRPDIVFVGIGTPKQDYWIDEHLEAIRGATLIGVGAAFDFVAGRVPRTPRWVQSAGFEWAYRLIGKDRKRLWKRYTCGNIEFLAKFLLQILGLRVVRSDRWSRD